MQHLKTSIPEADAKRVAGVKTMEEMWRRLEKVYGDTELNIITVKTNLENFSPKATSEHKRIMEVFAAIESAVTQLQNLDALQYLNDDFGLMSKLVLKLPLADQKLGKRLASARIVINQLTHMLEPFHLVKQNSHLIDLSHAHTLWPSL